MGERVKRRYRVEETLTVVGVGYVEAASKAEAREMVYRSEVEFSWNDGQDVRRGDGIKVFLDRPTPPPVSHGANEVGE